MGEVVRNIVREMIFCERNFVLKTKIRRDKIQLEKDDNIFCGHLALLARKRRRFILVGINPRNLSHLHLTRYWHKRITNVLFHINNHLFLFHEILG